MEFKIAILKICQELKDIFLIIAENEKLLLKGNTKLKNTAKFRREKNN